MHFLENITIMHLFMTRQSFRVGDNVAMLLPPLEEATLIPESLSEWNIVFALCSVTDRDTSFQDAR